jgi:hypothetical protein
VAEQRLVDALASKIGKMTVANLQRMGQPTLLHFWQSPATGRAEQGQQGQQEQGAVEGAGMMSVSRSGDEDAQHEEGDASS